MTFPDRLPDLLTCARQAATQASRVLLGKDALLFDTGNLAPGSTVAYGVAGVRVFAEDIITWPYRLGPEELEQAVKALPVFIEKAGTGGGFFRRLQADFCDDVASYTGDRAFATAARVCQVCANAWSELGQVARADPMDINALAAAAQRLPRLEEIMQQALADAGNGRP